MLNAKPSPTVALCISDVAKIWCDGTQICEKIIIISLRTSVAFDVNQKHDYKHIKNQYIAQCSLRPYDTFA